MRMQDLAAAAILLGILFATQGHALAQGGGAGPGANGPVVFSTGPGTAPATVPEGTGAITGVVIDGLTRAPIPEVVVALANPGGRGNFTSQPRQVTDAKGRFAFVNLPAGERLSLAASKRGYLDGGYNRNNTAGAAGGVVTLREGEWLSDVKLVMWRPGAIGGAVTDERGEPVVGVYVRVLTRLKVAGRETLAAGPMTRTDDRGMYRIAALPPGRYVVVIPSVQGSTAATSGMPPSGPPIAPAPALDIDSRARLLLRSFPIPPAPAGGFSFGYPITFHPGTTAIASAATIDLAFGEERGGLDIALQPAPTWKVAGRVEGPPEALQDLVLRLLPEGLEDLGQGAEAATATVGADGRFLFLNVPAGTYTIDAPRTVNELKSADFQMLTALRFPSPTGRPGGSFESQSLDVGPPGTSYERTAFRNTTPNYLGRASVVVGGHDEDNVIVPMRPGGTMTGHVAVEADPNQTTPGVDTAALVRLDPITANPAIGLLRTDWRPGAPPDDFKIEGLTAAKYFLRVSLWTVKSVRWQGRDYTDVPFDAAATQDFTGVEVTVTNKTPVLAGSVRDAQGAPADGALVVVFPTEPARWANYGLLPSLIRSSAASNTGRYKVTTLPAGEYYVVAVPQDQRVTWSDPEFFKAAAAVAHRVTLSWGDTTNFDTNLAVIPGGGR